MKQEKEIISLTKEKQLEYYCEECGESIDPQNVNISNSIAKCKNCSSLFSLEESEFEKRRSGHPIFLVPDGTDVLKLITSLEITSAWMKASKKDKMKFDFIFAASFGFISSIALVVGISSYSLFLSIVALFFFFAAFFLNYIFLADLINKTHINISANQLKIEHKPLKFFTWKEYKIPIDSIKQLYVKEYDTNRSVNNKTLKAYGLFLIQKSGEELKILEEMNRETSLYIEQEIEEFLQINNASIKGEINKTT